MYIIKNKDNEKTFIELMEVIKKTNMDWINLRQSKDYKIGMALQKTAKNFKKMKIKDTVSNFKKWNLGIKKVKKYKEKNYQKNTNENANYFSNERIAVYTCIFGNYDNILEPYFIPDNCDFYIFTDQEINTKSAWKKMDLPNEINEMSNIDKNRYIKMLPHLFFENYNYSIYVDGNVQILTDLTEYINKIDKDTGIGIHMHHLRDCVYDELEAIVKMNKQNKKMANKYKEKLDEEKMPRNYGLLQCNIIARKHNNLICKKVMESWWDEFKESIKRDQISLPYVLYKNNINIDKVGTLGNNVYTNPSFRVITHK